MLQRPREERTGTVPMRHRRKPRHSEVNLSTATCQHAVKPTSEELCRTPKPVFVGSVRVCGRHGAEASGPVRGQGDLWVPDHGDKKD